MIEAEITERFIMHFLLFRGKSKPDILIH
uniref:Uncharacterized protein n=1 Tax=Solanum lycopersicum TaxID=4081 RepID=A0A3Q7JEG2_SOLLC